MNDDDLGLDQILADVPTYDAGQVLTVTIQFSGDPEEVCFSCIRPKETRAIVDPGSAHPGTRLARLSAGVYQITLDTTGWRGGDCRWHAWGTRGPHQASRRGMFRISEYPAQLL